MLSATVKINIIKEQEASGLLSSLRIRTALDKIPLVDPILLSEYKMNEMINTFLLAGDKFMPQMHLRQPILRTKLADHLLKTKKEFKNFKKQQTQDIFIKTN